MQQRLRQLRVWDPRLLWLAAVDVIGTLLLISFLIVGHHQPTVRVWAVLMWVVIVPGIPAAAKWRYRWQHP
jgi:hypothetical protein